MNEFDYIKLNIDRLRKEMDSINKNVKLLGVTKTVSRAAVEAAILCGLVEFGESKVQEAAEKIAEINALHEGLTWHFIGHLQSNKTKKVIENFGIIESCDSAELLGQISAQSINANRITQCLLEIKVSNEKTKFGILPEDAAAVIDRIKHLSGIKIAGFMAMAPYSDNPKDAGPYFKKARKLFDDVKLSNPGGNVSMEILSMGMSDDYKTAMEEGSTQIRIGTAIFGRRDYI